jgi:hypothetical protein
MRCLQCQHENRGGLKFCNQCGTPLSGRCKQCGFENESGSKFCGECGDSLTRPVAPTPNQTESRLADSESRFQALLPFVIGLLRGQQRITYRTLKYALRLDDTLLEEIRNELAFRQLARDELGG